MLESKKKFTFPVTIQLTEKDYEALRREAFEQETSLSALARYIIHQYIVVSLSVSDNE